MSVTPLARGETGTKHLNDKIVTPLRQAVEALDALGDLQEIIEGGNSALEDISNLQSAITDAADHGPSIPTFTVLTVPDVAEFAGRIIHVSDGAGGSPCLAWSDGTDWLQISLGSAISAE